MLLGSSAVGKTTLAEHYCKGGLGDDIGPTVGGVYYTKNRFLMTGEPFPLHIWDTAGEEKYRSMASM